MKVEQLMTVLLAPKVTEKTVAATEKNNTYTFKVLKQANKLEIKKAIEMAFEVTVNKVRTSMVKGKQKRYGQRLGRRASWKKAVVTLAEGQSIELMDAD